MVALSPLEYRRVTGIPMAQRHALSPAFASRRRTDRPHGRGERRSAKRCGRERCVRDRYRRQWRAATWRTINGQKPSRANAGHIRTKRSTYKPQGPRTVAVIGVRASSFDNASWRSSMARPRMCITSAKEIAGAYNPMAGRGLGYSRISPICRRRRVRFSRAFNA